MKTATIMVAYTIKKKSATNAIKLSNHIAVVFIIG
jgi:hypothetical protein